jgi:hypothetical protein
MKRARPEDAVQRGCAQILDGLWRAGRLRWAHVPNGGKRSPIEAGIFSTLGVKPGVPDIFIALPGGRVIWVEVKAADGRLSPAQVEWRDALRMMGHDWHLLRHPIELWDILPPDVTAGILTNRPAE